MKTHFGFRRVGENALLKIVGRTTSRVVCIGAMLLCIMAQEGGQGGERASDDIVATYSIVAYDPHTKEWGVAVQSKFFGVGSVVPWAKAGVGAIATQAQANVRYGPRGLELLEEGKTARQTLQELGWNRRCERTRRRSHRNKLQRMGGAYCWDEFHCSGKYSLWRSSGERNGARF